ncbi:hypothetical protein VTP01DRAFT_2928 [Rhizomucor pusillus]|uniref:uncharacterized protein n=1 Tax=Rhizomucor pusillus TaxID=4840 RepID=UPI0037435516
MEREHYTHLVGYYNEIYGYQYRSAYVIRPDRGQKIVVSDIIQKVPSIHLLGQLFISRMIPHKVLRLSIQYFFRHIIKIEQRYVPHVFAFVEWLKPSQPFPSYQDLDMHVFQTTCFPASKDSIIPVHRMYSGVGIQKLNTENTCSAFHLSRKIKITDH